MGVAAVYPSDYTGRMYTIRRLPEFDTWFASMRDRVTLLRLAKRLDKAQRGLLGDVQPVGDSVYEMREHFGPGWRMYYVLRGTTLLVMLGGGDKSTQQTDIDAAKRLASTLED